MQYWSEYYRGLSKNRFRFYRALKRLEKEMRLAEGQTSPKSVSIKAEPMTNLSARTRFLAVFSEGVTASSASEELRRGFVTSACLNLPDVG